jgi:membrane protease YdiL (CAAX protease family)
MAVVVEGALAVVAVLLAWLFSVPLRELIPPFGAPLGWAVGRGLIATVPMLAVFWWLVHSERPTFRELRRQVEWLIGEMFPSANMAQLALVAALAGVGEELLFRGTLQTIFGWWTTPVVGLMIASVLFGAMHALSKVYFILATVIGFCFGWMTWYYHDLVGPMVAHGVYDFVALMYLSRVRGTR